MTRDENLARMTVVLVEPQDSQNIGSVTRAMKTMGLSRLAIVGRTEFDEDRVRQLSVHAFDVFENKKLYGTLSEALAGESFSVAFTRRRGKFRKLSFFTPSELCAFMSRYPGGGVSLVFGRESNGLTDDEVEACNSVCTIETSDAFGSLNLSQAVQIACYSLFSGLNDYSGAGKAVSAARIGTSVDAAVRSLDDAGFFKESSPERHDYGVFIKDFLSRGSFSEGEMSRIDKFFLKLGNIVRYKNR